MSDGFSLAPQGGYDFGIGELDLGGGGGAGGFNQGAWGTAANVFSSMTGNNRGGQALGGAAQGAAAGMAFGPKGALIGAGLGLVSGLFSGGGKQKVETGLTLPPALEAQMLYQSSQNLQMMRDQIGQVDQLVDHYTRRIDTYQEALQAGRLDDNMRTALTESAAGIAISLGKDAEFLKENGWLNEDDIARIEELDEIRDGTEIDKAFEADHDKQRAALEQELMRNGASHSVVAQTLMQFDSDKAVERQHRGEMLKDSKFNRALTTFQQVQHSRGLGLSQAGMAMIAMNNQLDRDNSLISGQLALDGTRLEAGMKGMEAQRGIAQEIQGQFDSLAEYKFSNEAKRNLKNGGYGYDTAGHDAARFYGMTDEQIATTRARDDLANVARNHYGYVGNSPYSSGYNARARQKGIDKKERRREAQESGKHPMLA